MRLVLPVSCKLFNSMLLSVPVILSSSWSAWHLLNMTSFLQFMFIRFKTFKVFVSMTPLSTEKLSCSREALMWTITLLPKASASSSWLILLMTSSWMAFTVVHSHNSHITRTACQQGHEAYSTIGLQTCQYHESVFSLKFESHHRSWQQI